MWQKILIYRNIDPSWRVHEHKENVVTGREIWLWVWDSETAAWDKQTFNVTRNRDKRSRLKFTMQRGVGKEMERRVTTCLSAMQIVRGFYGSDQPQSGSSSDPCHRSKISAHLWPPVPVLPSWTPSLQQLRWSCIKSSQKWLWSIIPKRLRGKSKLCGFHKKSTPSKLDGIFQLSALYLNIPTYRVRFQSCCEFKYIHAYKADRWYIVENCWKAWEEINESVFKIKVE